MNKNPTVYLDMDGVLVDFVGGLHLALGLYYDPVTYPYKRGDYEMFPYAVEATKGRHTMDSLIQACRTVPFWANLSWDRRGRAIMRIVERYTDQAYLASYPMDHHDAWVGKLHWVDEHLPGYKSRLILMTAHKQLLARPGAILIDDRDDNISQFIEAGGQGYLVPQPWNSKHELFDSETDWLPDFELWMKNACKTTSS
jgi:5'(3')-deoxyribonucleotidase